MHNPSLWARLESHTIPEPNSGCLLWLKCVGNNGYGNIRIAKRTWTTHRLAWHAAFGPIPDGMHVCHKCDVRSCLNPNHLFIGTNADNVADMVAKGRVQRAKGSQSSGAVLTEDVVLAIRAAKGTNRAIAKRFGVFHTTIGAIRRRETWKHVP
jgi:hypothetical protein